MQRSLFLLLALFIGVAFLFAMPIPHMESGKSTAFGKQTLYVGARGGDVYELQGRLKFLGFYTGRIDGVFGWRTYWAVRHFQYEFGMKVDGIVGGKTKYMLWKASRNWRPGGTGTAASPTRRIAKVTNGNFSANDIRMMANAVYGEARGESYEGQVAVAAVILNRVEHPSFPKTPAGVIFQPGAFTAVADGQIWLSPNETAKRAVQDAINGWDPSGGAIYYFNPATATSAWIWSRPQIKRIGKHIFCR